MGQAITNLSIETAGTEEEAAELLEAALGVEVGVEGEVEGEEGGVGNPRAMGALEFLTQDEETIGTKFVDAYNEFNELSRLEMLSNVRHRWPARARFAFNCYRHYEQPLLRRSGEPPVTILVQEGVTQGGPLSMVLYRITLVPLAQELRAVDPGLLFPFYPDDVAFDGSAQRSTQLLKLLIRRVPDWGYFPEPDKSLFISDTPGQEEAARREFVVEGLVLYFCSGSRYLGACLGLQEELSAWVKPQVEVWAHGVRILGQIA